MTIASSAIKRLVIAAALGAAVLVGMPGASRAADLGIHERGPRVGYVRIARPFWNWRERCAYAGHYCLYAEYGYVYHYPYDDRPASPTHRFRYR